MSEESLSSIVELCLALDRRAVEIYRGLGEVTSHRQLAGFWKRMCAEEEEHVLFWEKLRDLVGEGHIPHQIFPNPGQTRRELQEKHDKVLQITAEPLPADDPARQFLIAFQLEFYILHPALEKLWHFYGVVRPGEKTPEDEYFNHLMQFSAALRLFGGASPELSLLGESVMQMWTQLRDLTREAQMDMLTRVLNRRGLFSDMRILAHLARRNSFVSGALLIDIDHFKVINDRFGHQVGDTVLTDIAGIISSQVRKSDIVGRYGGEEFLVFLPQMERTTLPQLAEKIRSSVEHGTRGKLAATVSVGAACTTFTEEVDESLDELIRNADICLYEAKAAGRNCSITRSCAN